MYLYSVSFNYAHSFVFEIMSNTFSHDRSLANSVCLLRVCISKFCYEIAFAFFFCFNVFLYFV